MDLTENKLLLFKFQMKVSRSSFKLIKATLATRLCHSNNLLPTSVLLKDTLRGMELSTSAIVARFFRTILNKFGY
jgi:hypothetical protein